MNVSPQEVAFDVTELPEKYLDYTKMVIYPNNYNVNAIKIRIERFKYTDHL